MPAAGTTADELLTLLRLPEVSEAVDGAREACTRLRWHEGLRRRAPEAAAESRVRGARASALLDGAELAGSEHTLSVVRDLMRGARDWPAELGPAELTTRAAVRVTAATEGVDAAALRSAAQVLSRLHLAAASGLVPSDQLGRPRTTGGGVPGELGFLGPAPQAAELPARLAAVGAVLGTLGQGGVPALVVAAVVHAELAWARPFAGGNALVARAVERVVLRVGGVDPTGVSVPEAGHAAGAGVDYRGALQAYGDGGLEGVRLWLLHVAEAVTLGAEEGTRIAHAVQAGRLDPPTG